MKRRPRVLQLEHIGFIGQVTESEAVDVDIGGFEVTEVDDGCAAVEARVERGL